MYIDDLAGYHLADGVVPVDQAEETQGERNRSTSPGVKLPSFNRRDCGMGTRLRTSAFLNANAA